MARPKKNTAAANDKPETTERLESVLWKAADKLRKNIDAAEYKHVVWYAPIKVDKVKKPQ